MSGSNDNETWWVRLLLGAAGIAFVAYYVLIQQVPHFYGLSGLLVYACVFAAIAQLVEFVWSLVRVRR